MSSTSNYNTLKVAELTELCKKRGLSGTGTKAVLVARLKKYDEENQNKVDTNIKKDEEDEVNVDDTDNLDVVGTDQTSTAPKTVATTGASSKSQTSAPTTQTQTTVSKEISDNNATTPNASNTQQQETTDTQPVDEETRKKMRAERFKIPLQESEANKAFQRAARFGLPVKGTKADQTVRQNKNLPAVWISCILLIHSNSMMLPAYKRKHSEQRDLASKFLL